jgi:hypothetical protein
MHYALCIKKALAQLCIVHYELCIKKTLAQLCIVHYELCIKKTLAQLCIVNYALCIKKALAQLCIVHYELCIKKVVYIFPVTAMYTFVGNSFSSMAVVSRFDRGKKRKYRDNFLNADSMKYALPLLVLFFLA